MRPRNGSSPGAARARGGGFTLIEILVLVVVLLIAAALIVPLAAGTSDLEVIAAARMIAADLQYAQNTAITMQQDVTVLFDAAAETYELRYASGPLIHPMTKSDYSVDFAARDGFAGLDIVSADFNGSDQVTFDVTGAPNNPGAVTLQAGPHVVRVDVEVATGKVTVTAAGP